MATLALERPHVGWNFWLQWVIERETQLAAAEPEPLGGFAK
jgi:hypothetical protein